MDEKFHNKRTQLFNLTITELLLLLIFLLLIFVGILLKKFDKLNDDTSKRIISHIYECPEMDCEYVIVPEKDYTKKLIDANTADATLKNETQKKNIAQKKAKEAKKEADKAKEEAKEAMKEADKAKEEGDKAKKELATGVGPPPCWIEPGTVKSTDFLFNIIMHSNGLQFINSYPSNRNEDFKSLPIIIDYSKLYSIEEFKKTTLDIYKFGIIQTNTKIPHPKGCRYYVTIYDNLKKNEKKLLKDYQKIIESVFLSRPIRDYNE